MTDNKRMAIALSLMSRGSKRYKPKASKIYEICRKLSSEAMTGAGNPMFGKKVTFSEERKKAMTNGLRNSDKLKASRASESYKTKIRESMRLNGRAASRVIITSATTGQIVADFASIPEAALKLGCSESNLHHAFKDNRLIGKKMKALGEKCSVTLEFSSSIHDQVN